jgi:hypothetical protein
MEIVNSKSKVLSYNTCNFYSLICLLFILPMMVVTIMVTKLFVTSDINKIRRSCSPISYFFGETTGCKKMIYDNTNLENFEIKNINTEIMSYIESSSKNIIETNEKIKLHIYHSLVHIIDKILK